jgi:hypothetical protein
MPGLLRLLAFYSTIGFVGITTEVLLAPYILSFGNAAHYGIVQSGASLGFLVGGFLLALLGNPSKVILIIIALETLICLALPALVWMGIEGFELNYNRRSE